MLQVNGPAPDFTREVSQNAEIKLENYLTYGKEMDLSKDEELSLLYNPKLLLQANVGKFLKD